MRARHHSIIAVALLVAANACSADGVRQGQSTSRVVAQGTKGEVERALRFSRREGGTLRFLRECSAAYLRMKRSADARDLEDVVSTAEAVAAVAEDLATRAPVTSSLPAAQAALLQTAYADDLGIAFKSAILLWGFRVGAELAIPALVDVYARGKATGYSFGHREIAFYGFVTLYGSDAGRVLSDTALSASEPQIRKLAVTLLVVEVGRPGDAADPLYDGSRSTLERVAETDPDSEVRDAAARALSYITD